MQTNCPRCGAPMTGFKCHYCDYIDIEGQMKADEAASKLNQQQASPINLVVNNYNNQIPPTPSWQSMSIVSPKSRLVTLIICIFLGFVGIHRFYVGKTGTGLVWMFTAGIGGMGWIVDIILILMGSFKDADGRYIKNW